MKKRKVLGPKVPCIKGKYHTVSMVTGICSNCGKQINKPDPDMAGMMSQVTRQVFGR